MSDQRPVPEAEAGSGTASPPIGTTRRRLEGPWRPAERTNFDWLSSPPRRAPTPFQKEFLDIEWSKSPLGPICQWTPWLKQMVMLVMGDPSPALIYFDNEYREPHAIVYNEALCPLIGDKHPSLQGHDPRIGFSEIWDTIGEIVDRGRDNYENVVGERQRLLLRRHGFTEETFWSWRFMPLLDPSGFVMASYATTNDDTKDVVRGRRSTLLHDIDRETAQSPTLSHVWQQLALVLRPAFNVFSHTFIFCLDEAESTSTHQTNVSFEPTAFKLLHDTSEQRSHPLHNTAQPVISPQLAEVFRTALVCNEPQAVAKALLPAIVLQAFESGVNDGPCETGVILPILSSSLDRIFGFVLVANNPLIASDDDQWAFVLNVMKRISSVASRVFLNQELSIKTAEYHKTQEKYDKLASRAPVGVASFAPNGAVQYANDYWYRLSRHDPGPGVDPMSWMDCVVEEDRDLTLRFWNQVQTTKEDVTFQLRLTTPRRAMKPTNGEGNISLLCTVYPDLDEQGNVLNLMSCITDVSDLKELEESLKTRTREVESKIEHVLQMKQQQEAFIDMTCHEIRNPLSAVLHLAEDIHMTIEKYLEAGPASDAGRTALESTAEAAETIIACVLHQRRIVDDILVISRIDSDLLHVTPVATPVRDAIQGSLRLFQAEARAVKTSLSLIEDASLEELGVKWLMLDPNRVTQILVNLVGNALKFTKSQKSKSIQITMSVSLTRPSEKDGDMEYVPVGHDFREKKGQYNVEGEVVWLSLSVRDSGKGLSLDEKKGLFKKFHQATKKTHTKYGGSGLGLWISKQLTELHGGQIGFVSEKDEGSDFTFFIKTTRTEDPGKSLRQNQLIPPSLIGLAQSQFNASRPDTPVDLSAQPRHLSNPYTLAPFVILVVEDNLVNQRVLARQLHKRGCTVHTANHGLEALKFLQTTTFWAANDSPQALPLSIILMDIEMPVMDGVTAAREIRSLESSGQLRGHVPVLAVTANARLKHRELALEAGMDNSITKPYQFAEIMALIQDMAFRHPPPATSNAAVV